jgi:4-hydroxy-4-methyl-2-oxoglutarate aldolase
LHPAPFFELIADFGVGAYMKTDPLPPALMEQLRSLDGCTVANAIETFDVRIRNSGFMNSSVHCIFEECPPIVGYAATARIRTSEPPMEGHNYDDRTDWWNHILAIPAPRLVVVEDIDKHPGMGAFIGEVHANILLTMKCIGLVTNGAVRDLPAVRASGFQMFAGNVSVSHAYAHIFDFGGSVVVGGLTIQPGDLMHGDLHGVQTVPIDIAERIPGAARRIVEKEQELIALCHSAGFTLEKLREAIKDVKP